MAQSWGSYTNARYGASADIPPGFSPMGPEAANSDGLIFRAQNASALLTVYGADVPGSDFEAKVRSTMEFESSYHGWNMSGSTITPDWAEISGSLGGRQVRYRLEAACGGRHLVAVKFEYNGNMNSTVSRVFSSLEAGAATSC